MNANAPGITLFETAIGLCGISWSERGITGVQLPAAREDLTWARLRRRTRGARELPAPPYVATAIDGITALLSGEDADLSSIELDLTGIEPFDRGMLQLIATYAFGHLLLLNGQGAAAPVRLAPREREALQWAAEGKTDWEIGEVMGISAHGVDFHLRSARTKLGTTNRTQAVATALRRGLII